MRDIDIIGVASDGKALLAQVTFETLKAWKLDRLLRYRNPKRTHLLFFCTCPSATVQDGISVFPIQEAYRVFASTPFGKLWLARSASQDITRWKRQKRQVGTP
jgi:hypothetical protein